MKNNELLDIPYKHFFETAQNPFFLTNKHGQVLAVNDAACQLFGFTRENAGQIRRQDVLDYNDKRLHKLLLQRERNSHRTKGEVTGILPGGERFPCEYSSVQFFNEDGERHNCTEITDMRKWKNAEKHIRQSEENLRAIFNHTVEGFVLVNGKLEIIASNDKAAEFIFQHGSERKVQAGHSLLEYLSPERKEFFKIAATKAMTGQQISYETTYPDANGSLLWYSFGINPVQEHGNIIGLCISGRDINPQKQAEEKLKNSEKRFRGLVENNTDAIAILTAEGKVLYVSPAGEKITGYTEAEALQLSALITIHEDDLKTARQTMDTVLANPGIPINAPAIRLRHTDGTWRWVEATLTNMLHDPAIRGIIVNFRDVTAQVEASLQLQAAQLKIERSEEKYRKIFDLSPLPKWIYDIGTLRILEVNQEAVRHYGYSREQFLSMTIMDVRPANEAGALAAVLPSLTNDVYKHSTYWRHLKKDGTVIMVEITGHPIEYEGRNARMVICRDVTERMDYLTAIEEQNKQLREIAWSQSHIVRAPLARILGLTDLATDPDNRTMLPEILPFLKKSAEELDAVICEIIKKTNCMNPADQSKNQQK